MLNKGATVAEVARSFAITETTWYRWKNTYGGMKATDGNPAALRDGSLCRV